MTRTELIGLFVKCYTRMFFLDQLQASDIANGGEPNSSVTADGEAKVTNADDDHVDDDDLDINELNELEASLSKATIQEPGTSA